MRRIEHVLLSPLTIVTIVVSAALVRGAVYLADRSLIIDEAFIALNLGRRSADHLTGELDWNQAAPIGFLEIEKLLVTLFGSSEYVLRAAPFAASLIALMLLAVLARRLLESYSVPLAVLVFAGIALATSYAAIAKPYSFDIAVVLALYLATISVLRGERVPWSIVGLAALGVVAPLLSYASVFAVTASAIALLIDAALRRSRKRLIGSAFVIFAWLIFLVSLYFAHSGTLSNLRSSLARENLDSLQSFRNSLGNLREVLGVSVHSNGLGGMFATLAALCAAFLIGIGVIHIARMSLATAAMLVLPGVFAFVASAAGWYPLLPRTMLFLAPTLALFVADGCGTFLRSSRKLSVRSLAIALVAVVIAAEAAATARAIREVRPDDGIKPIMATLAERQRPGDTIYLSYAAQYPFAHYLECRCAGSQVARAVRAHLWKVKPTAGGVAQWSPALTSSSRRFRIGVFRGYDPRYLNEDLRALPRGRVWVILAGASVEQSRAVVARLNRRGQRLWTFHNRGGATTVSGYLYKF
jgi:uncharacterized membrane protein